MRENKIKYEGKLEDLKSGVFETPEICSERARLVTESYKETEGFPTIIRVAKSFEKVLINTKMFIIPRELIVGNLASKPNAAPIYPEFGVKFIEEELDEFNKRPFDKFTVKEDTKEELKSIISYWKGKTREENIVKLASLILPESAKKAWDLDSFGIKPVIYAGYRKASGGSSHTVLDYEKVLEKGIKGIIKESEVALAEVDFSKRNAIEKICFLKAVIICYKAIKKYFIRYAELARKITLEQNDNYSKKELNGISERCNWISENSPRTFWEALQLVWSIHLFRWIESNGHSVTIGRIDQFLYPYYKRDIDSGKLDREEAKELISNFFIKIAQIKKVRPWSETVYKGGYPTFQAITLSGQTSEGLDTTNDLSYLILEVTGILKLPEPVIICRIHNKTPDNFLQKAIQMLIEHGGGLPSFFSDEAIVPALQNENIPFKEAIKYSIVACSEPAIPGKHIDHTGASIYINLAKLLELTLNGGVDPSSGICLCSSNKNLSSFNSFDDLKKSFKEQLRYYMNFIPILTAITSSLDPKLNPTPFASALLDYRIKMGMDMTEGGGLNDNNTIIQGHGLPNVANSFAAIKKLVFEENRISGLDLLTSLRENFKGSKGEMIRRVLLKCPKYGNDDDYVDSIIVDLAQIFINELKKCSMPWRGGSYGASLQGLTANVPEGKVTGATPDGRKSGEALADNISPQAGTDINGVTAMLKSTGKINHTLYLNGTILNVKIHPTALKGEGINKLAALIKTYLLDFKGWQVQFNIISAKQLKNAQKQPEINRNLIVKVAGYSAQFISLDKKLQDQIIQRSENVF